MPLLERIIDFLSIIRSKLKKVYDSINNDKLKRDFLNALPFWVGAFATGFMAVIYAKLFKWAEELTHYLFHHQSWYFFIISPICFLIAWYIVAKSAPYARGSGIPQVSAAIELANPGHYKKVDKLLSFRIISTKIISSLIMVVGGGVVGREGPTVQISASIFKKINDWLPEWYPKISKRNMIVTGAAAGLASAFNTPLGGIVFAIEELTKTHFSFFKSALFTGVIIAGLTALNFFGPYLYIGFPQLDNIPFWIIFPIILIGIVSGVASSGMGKIIVYILSKKNKLKKIYQNGLYAVVIGLTIAGLAYFIDERVLGSGQEIMISTLFTDDKHLEWYIPILRVFGTIISFTVGAAGGIFAPSLSAGASLGAVLSDFLQLSNSETNLIVLCGMVGALTGITRSPFTSSILVLEMTNSHDIIFHLMLTALSANLIANLISRHSFYDILKNNYLDEIQQQENDDKAKT
ncbi:MAG: chloride channel protein [Flavobacteriales bacterium]|nr:chloride channel protein [Flavobacteriales bacterium]